MVCSEGAPPTTISRGQVVILSPSSGAPAGGRRRTLAAGASPLPLPSPPSRRCQRARPGEARPAAVAVGTLTPLCGWGWRRPARSDQGAAERGTRRRLCGWRGALRRAWWAAMRRAVPGVWMWRLGRIWPCGSEGRGWSCGRAATSAGSSLPGGGGGWWCVLVVGDGGCDFGGGSARSDFSAVRASEGLGCRRPPRPGPCRLVGVAAQ